MNKVSIKILIVLLLFSTQLVKIQAQCSEKKWVDSTYQSLTLSQKLGQLFMVAAYTNKDEAHHQEIRRLIEKEEIGGLIFMQDNAEKQIDYTNIYQRISTIPLLLGMDAEWDLSMRLKNTFKFPYAMTLGAIQNNQLIYSTGKKIAQHAKRLGVYWNFAPVVDVNTNPNNPIIGNRSFGSNIHNVADKGTAFMLGMKSEGVLASAKHFPGHGDTQTDSHLTTPLLNHSLQRLDSIELFPFKQLIANDVDGIMIAHLSIPAIEKSSIPSTLSYTFVTEMLKNKLQFNNLIVTDALNMQGVASKFPAGIVDMMAFKAGNDVLLFSQNVSEAKKQITKALENEEIPMSRVEESVKKILAYKYRLGLSTFQSISKENLYKDLNDAESDSLHYQLYANAMTLVENKMAAIPFKPSEKIYVYNLTSSNDSTFIKELQKYVLVQKILSPKEFVKLPKDAKILLFNGMNTNSVYASYKITNESIAFIEKTALQNNVILVQFGSPYSLKNLKTENLQAIVVSYENNKMTQEIVAKQLTSQLPFLGKLPVGVNAEITFGKGITTIQNTK